MDEQKAQEVTIDYDQETDSVSYTFNLKSPEFLVETLGLCIGEQIAQSSKEKEIPVEHVTPLLEAMISGILGFTVAVLSLSKEEHYAEGVESFYETLCKRYNYYGAKICK